MSKWIIAAIRTLHPHEDTVASGRVDAGLGDTNRAFEWMEKAIEARSWELPMAKVSPVSDNSRSDPRFPALLNRIGLPD